MRKKNRKKLIFIIVLLLLFIAITILPRLHETGTIRIKDNYSYVEKANKLIINPCSDERFASGLLLCDSTWFGAIEYFNNNNFDIIASGLIKDKQPILTITTTWGPFGGEHPFDTIRFSSRIEHPDSGFNDNPQTDFDSFILNSSEFEVSGMKVGEDKEAIAKFLGLRKNQIRDTITIINPYSEKSKRQYGDLFEKSSEITISNETNKVWERVAGTIHFIFSNDTISQIYMRP